VDWWSAHVETLTDGTGLLDDDATGRFADLAAAHHGVIAAGGIPEGWSATISVQVDSAAEAATEAVRIVTGIAADAGMPAWPVVRAEAVREDVLDEELSRPPVGYR
jgi:hypothetical protein